MLKTTPTLLRTMAAFAALAATLATPTAASANNGKIAVVAAENFYGGIARQIGGDRVSVVSIMNNPDQDPHLFETTPGIVRQIADARIVIVNGADYDPWMDKLIAAAPRPGRTVIRAAHAGDAKAGGNPHLWYAPATMPAVAKAIAAALTQADNAHAADYSARLATVLGATRPHRAARGANARQTQRRRRHRDRAGVRPDGRRARPDHAQSGLSARDDERYRTEREARSPPSKTI